MQSRSMEIFKHFGIPLIHAPETAKLPFCPVPVAMVVAIFGGELAARDGIDHFDACHHLYWKWQCCFPAGCETFLVLQVEAGGGSITDTSYSTHVVVHLVQHIGLGTTRKIEKEHIRTG